MFKEGFLMEIKGKFATAIAFAKVIDDGAVEQIKRMCDYDFTEGSDLQLAAWCFFTYSG